MKFLKTAPLIGFLVIAMGTSCSSSFTRMETVLEYRDLAIYRLSEASYPTDEEVVRELPPVEHFPELDQETLLAVMGNLEYEKHDLWITSRRRVFYDEEMRRIIPVILRSIHNLPPGDRLVIISRYDPDKSVLSRMERVSLIFWKDNHGLNLLFGDIREEIPHNDPLAPDDWTNILPISFSSARSGHHLIPPEGGHLKVITNQEHQSWIVFPQEAIGQLVYHPYVDPDDEKPHHDLGDDESGPPPENGGKPEDRSAGLLKELRDLNQAKEEGLITEEEHATMRERIMTSYGKKP